MRHDGGLVGGGGEVQALETAARLRKRGLEVDILTPFTDKTGDVAHFMGCLDYFADTATILKSRGVPVATSTIWHRPRPLGRVKLDAHLKRLGGTFPRSARRLFRESDVLFTPTQAVEERLEAFFGLDRSKMFRVPNAGVSEKFAEARPEAFREAFDIEDDFVLHVGMLTHRKNQLGVIRALKGTGKRMVFLGRTMQDDYAEQCRKEAGDQAIFLDPLPYDSPLIGSAYAAARVVCIPSHLEDFLIAGMEAAIAGAKLVLSRNWYPQELYGDHALYPDANNPGEIRQAIEKAWGVPTDRAGQQKWFLDRYTWDVVAKRLIEGYDLAISRSRKAN